MELGVRHLSRASVPLDLGLLVVGVFLIQTARRWLAVGASFPLLLFLQLGGSLLATVLILADLLKSEFWLERTAATVLLPAAVCFLFNYVISRMPR